MINLEDEAALARALGLPIDPHVRALLAFRRDALQDAVLTVVEPGDAYAAAEAAVGLPLLDEGEPTFDWALRHPGGIHELAFDFGDTIKKFASLMDKKESSLFAAACRRVAMMGGTVLGLAHTTKNPNTDGSGRYAGTTDLVDDADAAYLVNPLQGGDANEKVVEFRCFKSRGDCAQRAAFAFAAERGVAYDELLSSVRSVDLEELGNFKRVEAERSDAELIEAVAACIGDGINTKMLLAKEAAVRTGASARAVGRLIERYCGDDVERHRWQFKRAAHGAQVFELLKPPPTAGG